MHVIMYVCFAIKNYHALFMATFANLQNFSFNSLSRTLRKPARIDSSSFKTISSFVSKSEFISRPRFTKTKL